MRLKKFLDSLDIYLLENINIINEGVYDPGIFKAVFLAGGPGSGKSFVAQKSTSGMGLKMVNSDTLFEILGKKSGINLKEMPDSEEEARNKVRSKAKDLTNKQLLRFINGRLGLIIDGTGRNVKKIEKQRNILKLLGYDTYMIFVNTSLEVAIERNKQRARSVPEKIVIKAWRDVQENMGKFQSLFGTKSFRIVDNSTYVSDKEVFSDVWKDIMKFVKTPISNHIAKVWIEQAKKKKSDKKSLDVDDVLL